ncbi:MULTISPECIES: glycosyl transferase [unclassified Sinorhizobium]|uniref:O-linked N-acetylglucosamine transferase, SPINDLY family protein n=1 Tax=unclassified Sinorhizobium TaxID=2613772 RepID=UPI003524C137
MTINTHLASDPASPLAGLLERARQQRLSLTELFQLAENFNLAGQREQAAELYKCWIAYNDSNPLLHLVHFNYSVTLRQMGDLAGSIHSLRACLKVKPQFGQGHINLGRALEDAGLTGQAIQQWQAFAEMTAEITPERIAHRLMVLEHTGRVLENAGLMEEAENALWKAIELRPDKTQAGQHWTALRQRQCKWPTLVSSEHVSHRQLVDALSPLTLACYADDPVFQLAKAYRYCKSLVGRPDLSGFKPIAPRQKSNTGQRLRIGYVSSDLRDHAVGFALSEVFETHDKSSVEIYAYYCGEARTGDATQTRMMSAIDRWRDISTVSDSDAAKQIIADEIDILVDVNGYTKHARTKIFAYRPAPVIVSFCGYPGTMGSPFHQYIIADEHIIPPEHEIYYSEKVLRIPCNQPVDRKRQIAQRPSRAEAGLPEDAFIFACFNGMQKITDACFGRWMAILSATPGSVLWLLGGGEDVDQRLRQAAEQLGVAPERLIFAPKAPNPKHLARIGLADLFLDTFPYGAHSTAADAITMGLPVLTFPGNGFASRFCSSIVAAAGVPELICDGPDDFVQKAVGFARDRQSLATVRQALEGRREASVLRDIPALVRRLEQLFWQMQGECERGETPVPDLSNLDVYYEVGAELMTENVEFSSNVTFRQRYIEKLAQWHAFSPIPHDNRLWTAATANA